MSSKYFKKPSTWERKPLPQSIINDFCKRYEVDTARFDGKSYKEQLELINSIKVEYKNKVTNKQFRPGKPVEYKQPEVQKPKVPESAQASKNPLNQMNDVLRRYVRSTVIHKAGQPEQIITTSDSIEGYFFDTPPDDGSLQPVSTAKESKILDSIYNYNGLRDYYFAMRLFEMLEYPRPWPESKDIESIEYTDGKLIVNLYDSKSEDNESAFEPPDWLRHRIQPSGYKTRRSDSMLHDYGKRAEGSVHTRRITGLTRSFRTDSKAEPKDNSSQQ